MHRLKRIVAYLCSVLIAAQAFAPLAYAAPQSAQQAVTAHAVSVAGCRNCADRDGHHASGCESARCAHVAGCCGPMAMAAAQLLPLHLGRFAAPSTARPTGFVQPDPDSRLRPPTLLHG